MIWYKINLNIPILGSNSTHIEGKMTNLTYLHHSLPFCFSLFLLICRMSLDMIFFNFIIIYFFHFVQNFS